MKKIDEVTARITSPAYSLHKTSYDRWGVTNIHTGEYRSFEFKFFAKLYIKNRLNNPPDNIEYYIK